MGKDCYTSSRGAQAPEGTQPPHRPSLPLRLSRASHGRNLLLAVFQLVAQPTVRDFREGNRDCFVAIDRTFLHPCEKPQDWAPQL